MSKIDFEMLQKECYIVKEPNLDHIDFNFIQEFMKNHMISRRLLASYLGLKTYRTIDTWRKQVPLHIKKFIYLLDKHPELLNELMWVEKGINNGKINN